jgi:putative ABC transport system ATP-binding protein
MIQVQNVSKLFQTRNGPVAALEGVSLDVAPGQFVVVRGPSGSGKTTLLLALGGMQRPSQGRILIDNQDLYALSPRQRAKFRARRIGFVFQMFHLVPYLSVLDNVLLAAKAAGNSAMAGNPTDADRARDLLTHLGLAHRLTHTPGELSAGERQRAALARALINTPGLILADEPTGNLDPENAAEVVRALNDYRKSGGTVIFVTHGHAADDHADHIIHLHQGRTANPATAQSASRS